VSEQTSIHGDVLPWSILSTGFLFNGMRVPLVEPQGIFKPAVFPELRSFGLRLGA
jgi:putative restriction endonuclease